MNHIPLTFSCGDRTLDQAFRIAIGDLNGNIQIGHSGLSVGKPVLMAGLTYEAWTRDAAVNVRNCCSVWAPDIATATLLGEVCKNQDRLELRGQYWDAVIWIIGALRHAQWTGDLDFLRIARTVAGNWLERMEREERSEDGLFRGASFFNDGVSAYPDRYADRHAPGSIHDWTTSHPELRHPVGEGLPMRTLSTNCLYLMAYRDVQTMDRMLGRNPDPSHATSHTQLRSAIQKTFWIPELGRYRYLDDPWGTDERQEGAGHAFALLAELPDDQGSVVNQIYHAAHGIPCLWPTYPRYARSDHERQDYGRHSGLIWPQVQAFWAEACAGAGHWERAWREIRSLAERAVRDSQFSECFHPDDGQPDGGVQEFHAEPAQDWHSWCLDGLVGYAQGQSVHRWRSQPRVCWGATGFIANCLHLIAGLRPEIDRLEINPHFPPGVQHLRVTGIHWRKAILDITVESGTGPRLSLDGRAVETIDAKLEGHHLVGVKI